MKSLQWKICCALIAASLGVGVAGCPRKVVLDPAVAAARNSADWTIVEKPARPGNEPATVRPVAAEPAAPRADSPGGTP